MAGQEADRLVYEVCGQMVTARKAPGGLDARIVQYELWRILIRFRIHESVEAVEAASQRPAMKWTRCACFGQGRDMPLAHHVIAIGVRSQHFGKGSRIRGDFAAIPGKAAVEIRETAHAHRVMIATR